MKHFGVLRGLRDADAALFFYAGHAMSFAGVNYLMPTDARLQDEADLPYEMAKVDDVISDLARARNVRILILDACRDNPWVERLRMNLPATRSAAVARGLERIERPQGMIAAFATQPGQVAGDGVGTRNSPFTSALLKHIATPGVESGTLFRRVAGDVYKATSGKQLPELQISLLGEFYFAGSQEFAAPGVGSQTIATAPATAPTETPSAPLQAAQPTLLGKYGDWGAYSASPDGKKVCFAIAKPLASKPASAELKRDSPHIFVSSRPADNVRNEVSVSIGYPFQASSLATAEIGDTKFTMWTKNDGAWIKDSADEQRLVDAMRKGTELVLKGVSTQGLQSIDRYSLKGLAQALDRIEQECR